MFENNDEGTIWEREEAREKKIRQGITDADSSGDGKAMLVIGAILLVGILMIAGMYQVSVIKLDATDWLICQHLNGNIEVMDEPGLHFRPFAKTWTYRRYSTIKMDDNCYFKEGRARKLKTFVRFQLPESREARMALHKMFNGQMHNIEAAAALVSSNAIRISTLTMNSHYFDVEGKSEIVEMASKELKEDLAHYGLTLSAFGIHDIIHPVGEIPQGAKAPEEEMKRQVKEIEEDWPEEMTFIFTKGGIPKTPEVEKK